MPTRTTSFPALRTIGQAYRKIWNKWSHTKHSGTEPLLQSSDVDHSYRKWCQEPLSSLYSSGESDVYLKRKIGFQARHGLGRFLNGSKSNHPDATDSRMKRESSLSKVTAVKTPRPQSASTTRSRPIYCVSNASSGNFRTFLDPAQNNLPAYKSTIPLFNNRGPRPKNFVSTSLEPICEDDHDARDSQVVLDVPPGLHSILEELYTCKDMIVDPFDDLFASELEEIDLTDASSVSDSDDSEIMGRSFGHLHPDRAHGGMIMPYHEMEIKLYASGTEPVFKIVSDSKLVEVSNAQSSQVEYKAEYSV